MSKDSGGSQTATTSIDKDIKAQYLRNLEQAKSVAGGLGVQQFAGFNPLYAAGEEQLVNTALGGPGIGSVDQAAYQTGLAGGYQPQMVGGFGGGSAELSGATGYGATDVTAAQANMADINRYMNPYTQNVTKNTLADLETGRQNAVRQIAQQAGAAKAFGGSRQGVVEAQTNIGFGDTAGKLLAQLNEQAYNNAMNAQQQDLARQQQAAMQNAAQRTSASQFGAGAMNQAQLSNAASRNAMAQFNANLAQQAALANQGAGLAGAQFRLGAANQLGNLGMQQQGLRMSGAQAVMGAGGARQQLEQARLDAARNIGLQRLGIVQGALGMQPANLGGITTQPTYRNQAAGALGGAAAGYQLGGPVGAGIGGLIGLLG